MDHFGGVRGLDNIADDVIIIAHEGVLDHIEGDIVPPDITFAEETSIYLDDLEVRLLYPGRRPRATSSFTSPTGASSSW